MLDTRFDDVLRALGAAATRRGVVIALAGALGGRQVEILARRRGRNRTAGIKASAEGRQKVTICHRTGSKKKPFQVITVSQSAVAAHAAHGDLVDCPARETLDLETCTCTCDVDPGPGCDPPCACGEICKVVDPDDDGACCRYTQREGECPNNGGDVAPFSCTEVCGDQVTEGGEDIPCDRVCGSLGHCGRASTCVESACCGHPICVPICGHGRP
jgi:hypothetical protein